VAASLILALLIAATGIIPRAEAVSMRGNLSATVTPDTTMSYATYSIDVFRTANNETVTGYTLTFPPDTDASAATSPGIGDTISVGADGRTVSVILGTPIPPRTNFAVVIGNVRNPSTAGTYAIASVTFDRTVGGSETITLGTNGEYAIVPAPYVMLTVTTPDDPQSLDFGAVDPGLTSSPKTVTVEVTSSAPFTLTREFIDTAPLGITSTSAAVRTGAAGTSTFTDEFTLAPPWTVDPGIPLVATIRYTVTQ
jgi:hypothetical protein